MTPANTAPSRRARFVPDRVILPEEFEPGRWYEVCEGRRREDQRPGTVLLALGGQRVPVPASCLELRDSAPLAPPTRPRRRWRPGLALALSIPVGLLAVATVGLIAVDLR